MNKNIVIDKEKFIENLTKSKGLVGDELYTLNEKLDIKTIINYMINGFILDRKFISIYPIEKINLVDEYICSLLDGKESSGYSLIEDLSYNEELKNSLSYATKQYELVPPTEYLF